MVKTITIANQKGGVGKTMTSVSLSAYLGLHDKRVLLVDLDPQGHSTKAFGYYDKNSYNLSIKEIFEQILEDIPINKKEIIIHTEEGVDLVPSNISLASINSKIHNSMCRETILKRFLDSVKDDYDFIIIDTSPSLDILPINAMTASDSIIITVQAEPYGVEGMADLLKSINVVKRNLNKDLKIEGVLITMTDNRTKLSKTIAQDVKYGYGERIKVFHQTIPRCIKAAESNYVGQSIFKYDPNGKATKAYEKIAKEVFDIGKKDISRSQNYNIR